MKIRRFNENIDLNGTIEEFVNWYDSEDGRKKIEILGDMIDSELSNNFEGIYPYYDLEWNYSDVTDVNNNHIVYTFPFSVITNIDDNIIFLNKLKSIVSKYGDVKIVPRNNNGRIVNILEIKIWATIFNSVLYVDSDNEIKEIYKKIF